MSIDFYTDFDPAYGEVIEVSPLIRRLVAKNPNPFTFTGTGVYMVGRGDVAVIDPGPSMDDHLDGVEAMLAPGERITHILITHTHTDHTAGVPKLKERTNAPTFGYGPHGPVPDEHPLDLVSFDEYFTESEAQEFAKAWDETPDELKREGPDTDFVPDEAVSNGDVIVGDGWTVDVVHTPGHTSNHVCFALREESTLFTGDHVMGWATSVISPPDGDLFDYMNSLEKLLQRPDERYLPTHGPVITRPHEHVKAFMKHRRGREAQIVTALAGIAPGEQIAIKDLVPSMYADVDKRLWRAAANSVYAHLLGLERQGRVEQQEEGWVLVDTPAPSSSQRDV